VILLNCEYEGGERAKKYRRRLEPARRAGREHWICPGTSCWNSFFFRQPNARENIRKFAQAGLEKEASGFLLTHWGDNGHYNFLSQAYWSIAYGADAAWRARPDARAEREFDDRFATIILNDPGATFVDPLRKLGTLYRDFGLEVWNTSPERMFFTGIPKTRAEPARRCR